MQFFSKYKKFLSGLQKRGGRNNLGRITVAHRGGGNKRRFRHLTFFNLNNYFYKFYFFLNFTFFFSTVIFRILTVERDPFRNVLINLCQEVRWGFFFYKSLTNFKDYFVQEPTFYFLNSIFLHSDISVPNLSFNCNFLFNLKLGNALKNVELFSLRGPTLGRAQGSFCFLRRHCFKHSVVELSSKKFILVNKWSLATPCSLFDLRHLFFQKNRKKAGYSRWMGIRPTVKGRAKNPIDHPHGGKSGPGGVAVTPWGLITKGVKTRASFKILREEKCNRRFMRQ